MNRAFWSILVFLICVSPAFAWHTNTHLQMTRDAIALMPPEFRQQFLQHKEYVEAGIKDPDELLKDWQNHYYIPTTPPEGGAIDRIDKLIGVVQMKFKNSTAVDTSKQLCYLAHYIADLWTPEALIKSSTASDAEFVQNNNIMVLFEGYKEPITNFHEYFQKRAEWRWRLENSKNVSSLLYSEAVNDIAKTWLTLWQQSGKSVEPMDVKVLAHKQGTLSVNYERLLADETYSWYDDKSAGKSYLDRYAAEKKEYERLKEGARPSDTTLIARAELRNQDARLSQINPKAPFQMLETSLKTMGDKCYFVARVFNKGDQEIPSVAFMYPGVKGPAAMVKNLKAGMVAKIEAILPADATKEQIQLIFSTPNS